MGTFSFTLDEDLRQDIVSFLAFRLWMLRRENPAGLRPVIELTKRVRATQTGTAFSTTLEEYGILYSAAQYTMAAMSLPLGKLYLEEMTKGRKIEEWKTEEWKQEYAEHLRDSCMYLVNESNSKFSQMPGFAQIRISTEKAVRSM